MNKKIFLGVVALMSLVALVIFSIAFFKKDSSNNANESNNNSSELRLRDYEKKEKHDDSIKTNDSNDENNNDEDNENNENEHDGSPMEEYDETAEELDEDYYRNLIKKSEKGKIKEEESDEVYLKEIYGEEEYEQALDYAIKFLEIYHTIDGSDPDYPDKIFEDLKEVTHDRGIKRLKKSPKPLITHKQYKTSVVDIERQERGFEFKPNDDSVPLELSFSITLRYESVEGDIEEEKQVHKVMLRRDNKNEEFKVVSTGLELYYK